MGGVNIWGNLGRALNDPTLVDEAIIEAVDAHSNDPDAHLAAGQSLTTHRAAAIIDHLAESVLNDKITPSARAYVAVVGSGLAGDYDSLESAISYAVSKGGGNILLMPGTYYLSTNVSLPPCVNLIGYDAESTFIRTNANNNRCFMCVDDEETYQVSQLFKDLTFYCDGSGVFSQSAATSQHNNKMIFDSCSFKNGGAYIEVIDRSVYLNNCYIQMGSTPSIRMSTHIYLDNCNVLSKTGLSDVYLFSKNLVTSETVTISIKNTYLGTINATNFFLVASDTVEEITIEDSNIGTLNTLHLNAADFFIKNTYIILKSTVRLTIGGLSGHKLFIGNTLSGGLSPNLSITQDYCIITNNFLKSTPTNSGTGNIVNDNITNIA